MSPYVTADPPSNDDEPHFNAGKHTTLPLSRHRYTLIDNNDTFFIRSHHTDWSFTHKSPAFLLGHMQPKKQQTTNNLSPFFTPEDPIVSSKKRKFNAYLRTCIRGCTKHNQRKFLVSVSFVLVHSCFFFFFFLQTLSVDSSSFLFVQDRQKTFTQVPFSFRYSQFTYSVVSLSIAAFSRH